MPPKLGGFEQKVIDALKNTDEFPPEFWAAVVNRLQNSPALSLAQDQLPPDYTLSSTDDPTTSRKIQWRSDQRGGAIVADVQAYTGLGPTIVAESVGKTATEPSQAILQTRNKAEVSGVGSSLVLEQNEGATAAKRRAAVYIPRESDGVLIGKTIFDSLGGSDFLGVASAGTHKIAFASDSLTWPGAASKSNVLTVTHGLGATPTGVVATQAGGTSPAFYVTFFWGNANSTTFDIAGVWETGVPGAGATSPFTWLAIS